MVGFLAGTKAGSDGGMWILPPLSPLCFPWSCFGGGGGKVVEG